MACETLEFVGRGRIITMASDTHPPKHMRLSFDCPRCGAYTGQTWFDLMGHELDGTSGYVTVSDSTVVAVSAAEGGSKHVDWTASKCFSCRNYSLWLHKTLAFPDPRSALSNVANSPHEDMPQDAALLFSEAVAVLPYSRRAAAALCRASMERLVKALDPECPKQAKLDDRLVRLEQRVSSPTIDQLNVLRHVGNTALHGEKDGDGSATIYIDEDDETIATTFFAVINSLVDELISKPRQGKELYDTLPEGVRKSYEAKAGRGGG